MLNQAWERLDVLGFSLSGTDYLVPLDRVSYIDQDRGGYRLVPDAPPHLLGLKMFHGHPVRVVDLRCLLHQEGRRAEEDLIPILEQREQDHVEWLDALERSLREGSEFTKARDPHQCAFGQWYDRYHTDNQDLKRVMRHFQEPHRRIHALAEELLQLREQGQVDKALKRLERERQGTLARLRHLFHMAREEISRSQRRILLFLEGSSGEVVAFQLDQMGDVAEVRREDWCASGVEEEIQAGPEGTLVEGYIRLAQQTHVLLDVEPLMALSQTVTEGELAL